ncbi:MAG TPA: glycosyltransferase family 4 protein [Solirubrobacteraceae bacterium]
MKPVLFATGHVPAYRVDGLARLHEREDIEVALFGGRARHGGAAFAGELPLPHRRVSPRELLALAAGGRYRAVVVPTGGRLALLGAWAGARRAGAPVIVWASLWAHPRSAAHALSYVPLLRLYRSADALVTYGPHVSAYVAARGARNIHIAPQAVDNDFWSSPDLEPAPAPAAQAPGVRFLFAGRAAPEKGLEVLRAAWHSSGLRPPRATLILAGPGTRSADERVGAGADAEGIVELPALAPTRLRDLYGAAEVLVVPSVATRTFREPWGLVVNEAMNRGLAVIASDAVGATAGGLVRDGETGLVVPAGDAHALALALTRLADDAPLRATLAAAGRRAVAAYNADAWAQGFSGALATLGLSRTRW